MSYRLRLLPLISILLILFSLNILVAAQDVTEPVVEDTPTEAPTELPSATPTSTETPTLQPSATLVPTNTSEPTTEPTAEPSETAAPEVTDEPTAEVTPEATSEVTEEPTVEVTEAPSIPAAGAPPIVMAPLNLVVNSTADPGTGTCDVTECTLREAINAANANSPDLDTITFNIPGEAPHTIQLLSALPEITDPVIIDGTTEPDYVDAPIIELDGTNLGVGLDAIGLEIGVNSTTIRGLVINRFHYTGILIDGFDSAVIELNYIGTDITGTTALGNGEGVIINNSDNNTIHDNVISGNLSNGLLISGSDNVITGNLIGTDATGTLALGNASATDGTESSAGISIEGSATIGGTTANDRNVISGNIGLGINATGSVAILGNYIGTDITGTLPLGNTRAGVMAFGALTIGGSEAGAGNVISANGDDVLFGTGIIIAGNGATVENNIIGSDVTGTLNLGNDVGVSLQGNDNVITDNIIAYNNYAGVAGYSGIGNLISENSIFANELVGDQPANWPSIPSGLGIDLTNEDTLIGVTLNDDDDPDTGANNLQNFPILTEALVTGASSVNVRTTLNSTPSTNFRIEYFVSDSCDASGNGEGQTYLGFGEAMTDANGDITFTTQTVGASIGQFITATATNLTTNDTSEFSACRIVAENVLPVANAGPDQDLVDSDDNGTVSVTLDGSLSTDPDGTIISYNWYDGGANLIASGVNPTIERDAPGVYTLQLIVTDNNGGTDDDFVEITVTSPVVTPPVAPSDLTATADSETEITLDWTDNSSDETEFSIERSLNGTDGWTEIATLVADETTYADTELTCGTQYFYRVRAYREGDLQFSQYSSIADTTTDPCTGAQTFIVNTTADPGTGICDVSECTLREAINAANANAGTDTIEFNIPGAAPYTIQPLTELPEITDPVIIDATTQPDYVNAPVIEIDGTNVTAGSGFSIASGSTTIRGFVINNYADNGILIETGGSNVIELNYIGTDVTGTASAPNAGAIAIDNSPNNIIQDNVLSGNEIDAIFTTGFGSSNNQALGNLIGTNAAGDAAVPNGFSATGGTVYSAVTIFDASSLIVGGPNPGDGNVISGNVGNGIEVLSDAAGIRIEGNYIGTDVTGTLDLGNTRSGISSNHATTIENNVIAHNDANGIIVRPFPGLFNTISANSIFDNANLGIDLGGDGITANDDGDGDTGANNQQNFPELYNASTGTDLYILGTLNSTPETSFRLEFFANDACDASGNGEGQTYLDFVNVITDANGERHFLEELTSTTVVAGEFITATATNLTTGDTSEFSTCIEAILNRLPSANAGIDQTIEDADNDGTISVTLDGTASTDPDGTIDTYTWYEVEDGNLTLLATGMTPTVDLVGIGVHTIQLVVMDNSGAEDFDFVEITAAPPTPPIAPTNLTATADSDAAITLNWTDNATDETSYSIERSDDGVDGWTEVGTEAADATTFTDDTLTCGTGYFYRVVALRDTVESEYSNTASAPTEPCIVLPPTDLTATADSYREITLDWTDNATDETSYSIERSDDGVDGWTEVGTAAADATTFTDDSLTCATEYFYRVVALRDAVPSEYSNIASATTEPCDTPLTFTVNNTADPGDGTCDVSECTLREAINAANANAALDTIVFDIPGTAPYTIQPLTALPEITDPVMIDGTTEPDYVDAPIIEVDGTNVNPITDGFHISTSDSIIRGLVINQFSHVIYIERGSNNTIADNYIGIDLTGTNLLDGNAIIVSESSDNVIENNVIGGTVRVDDYNPNNTILAGSGNIIRGNHIGVDVTGTASLNYGGVGVWIDGPDTTIGGTNPEDRNIISGNGNYGIITFAENTLIQGNYIGTDITGTQAIGNGDYGISVAGFVGEPTIIGGTEPGAGNLISGNGDVPVGPAGIYVGNNTVVQGNLIGTDVTGTQPLGNVGAGILVAGSNNTIGGTEAGAGNIIRFNSGTDTSSDGVYLGNGTGNIVLGNTISDNAGLGINIDDGNPETVEGVTPNDEDDADTGGNNWQNFPVLSSAVNWSTDIYISGTLNSIAETNFRIEFFANDACDASGNGEGETYLGFIEAATDANGDLTFDESLTATVTVGQFITATATNLTTNDTSEFSACVEVVLDTSAPSAPTELVAQPASATSIDLIWTNNATDETGYSIERSADGVSGWTEIATPAADATTFTDTGLACETEYFYRVRAVRDAAMSDYSNSDSATTFSCVEIVLRRPADGGSSTTTRPRFQWNRNNGAARYQFQLATDNDFEPGDIVLTFATNNNKTTKYAVPKGSELAFGTYYWRVNADTGSGTFVPASPVFSVIITPRTPAAPRQVAPSNNALLTDLTPEFSWLAVTGQAEPYTYQIEIDDDSRFRSPLLSEEVDALTFTPSSDLPDGRWYWRVRALNSYGAGGKWSASRKFTIDTTAPVAPSLRKPADESSAFNPSFQWDKVSDAKKYHIQISETDTFTTPIIEADSNGTTYRLPKSGPTLGLITYYWRVQAQDAAGNIGEYSDVFSFNNNLQRSPSDDSFTTNTRPRFQWYRLNSAVAYQLQVATDAGFGGADIVVDETFNNGKTTSYSVPKGSELPIGIYYWRVNVDVGSGMQTSAFYFTLTVTPTPPKAPVLISPTKNAVVSPTPDFVWQAVTGAAEPYTYEVQIDNDSRFRSVDQSNTDSPTTYTADPLADGRWYWRVRAVNNLGVPGKWSKSLRFEVDIP